MPLCTENDCFSYKKSPCLYAAELSAAFTGDALVMVGSEAGLIRPINLLMYPPSFSLYEPVHVLRLLRDEAVFDLPQIALIQRRLPMNGKTAVVVNLDNSLHHTDDDSKDETDSCSLSLFWENNPLDGYVTPKEPVW